MMLNQSSKAWRVFVSGVGIVTTWLVGPPVYAEINYQDMKGVHELINSKYEYLSPIHGFTLLGTKTLENMRFYGNYGPKKEGVNCLEKATQIHQILIKNHDCPQDKTAELIQRFFPSQDGVNFVANQIGFDPVSHFDPEVLGKLVSRMAHVEDSDLIDEKKSSGLQADLKDIMYESLNSQGYYKALQKRSMDRVQKLRSQIHKHRNSPEKSEDCAIKGAEAEFEELTTQLASIKNTLKKMNSNQIGQKAGRGNEAEFEEIAGLLVGALKESRIPGANGMTSYPKHLPEQLLLAYFWKKADEKRDFIRLLNGMQEKMAQHSRSTREPHSPPSESVLRDPTFLANPANVTHFLSQKYSKTEFNPEAIFKDPKHAAKEFLENPEKLAFYAHQENLEKKDLPPILSYAQAKHSSLSGGTYSDCGETSLRNFLNISVYDKKLGKFDAQILNLLQEKNSLSIHPSLLSFYQKHSDPAASVGQGVRDDWSETITSKHEGVTYNKPAGAPLCEISSSGGGIDNMMVVLDRLLFDGKKKDPGSILEAKDRAGKLDALCKALFRDGFDLSWNLKGSDKQKINEMKFGDIEFSVNGRPSFIWQFKQGHFVVQEIHKSRQSWKDKVAKAMVEEMNESRPSHSESSAPLSLQWMVTEQNFDQLEQSKQLPSNSIYSLPLTSNDGKLFAFEKILQNQMSSLYPLAKRLQDRLPPDDNYTQKQIHSALADYDYPWGEPPHVIGKPDVKYPRVTDQERELLVAKYGKSFEKARITPRGWIVGDTLKNEDGTIMAKNWEQAKEECKQRGAVLLPETEYEAIGNDFGYRSGRYIPQFLPNLYSGSMFGLFWASSPNGVDNAWTFSGRQGSVEGVYNRGSTIGVRCGVEAAWLIH